MLLMSSRVRVATAVEGSGRAEEEVDAEVEAVGAWTG